MVKKGIAIWLFSSLTFISLLHLIDATFALFFNSSIKLLQLYPIINENVQNISPTAYFWISAVVTFTLWGITCGIAFDNPVETYLNKTLSDAKTQSMLETQVLENKNEIEALGAIYKTIEEDKQTLAQIKDLMFSTKGVKGIQPLRGRQREDQRENGQSEKRKLNKSRSVR